MSWKDVSNAVRRNFKFAETKNIFVRIYDYQNFENFIHEFVKYFFLHYLFMNRYILF